MGDVLVAVLVLVSAFCANRISIIIVCLHCNRHPTRVYLFPLVKNTRLNCYLDISRYSYICVSIMVTFINMVMTRVKNGSPDMILTTFDGKFDEKR